MSDLTLEERVTNLENALNDVKNLGYTGSEIDTCLDTAKALEDVGKIENVSNKIKHLITTTGARVDKLGRMRKDFTVGSKALYYNVQIFDEGVKNDTSKCPVIAEYINNYMGGNFTAENIENALSRLIVCANIRENEQSNTSTLIPAYSYVTFRTNKNIYVQIRPSTGGYLPTGGLHLDCILFMI